MKVTTCKVTDNKWPNSDEKAHKRLVRLVMEKSFRQHGAAYLALSRV